MALIREKREKMGHSGSCRPNSLSECLFVYLELNTGSVFVRAYMCMESMFFVWWVGEWGFTVKSQSGFLVGCIMESGNVIITYLEKHTYKHTPTDPTKTPPPTPGWDPARLSVCGMRCMWQGCSSWAEPAIKQHPISTIMLSSVIGAQLVPSQQWTVFLFPTKKEITSMRLNVRLSNKLSEQHIFTQMNC